MLHVFFVFPEEIFNSFSFLRNMFSNEFILCPGATVQVGNVSVRSERNLKGSDWFSQFIGFLLDDLLDARCSAAACRLCCLLSSPLLFTLLNCLFTFTSAHVQIKDDEVRFVGIRVGLV